MPGDDSIKIYSAKRLKRSVDTTSALKLAFPAHALPDAFTSYSFRHPSFDINVLNILFKLRPSTTTCLTATETFGYTKASCG